MILLASPPDRARTALVAFLSQDSVPPRVCDSLEEAEAVLAGAAAFEVAVVDHRLLREKGPAALVPFTDPGRLAVIVTGAPFGAELDLALVGASAVAAAGYSPRSVAQQAVTLARLVRQRARGPGRRPVRPAPRVQAGPAVILADGTVLPAGRGRRVRLTPRQRRLVECVAAGRGAVLGYETLHHLVWRRPYSGNNGSIRECVSELRGRLRLAGHDPGRVLRTVHGIGYFCPGP
jgi:DNA-binding response OmpR family regulator